jgi:two-component system NarL family sensor kinase
VLGVFSSAPFHFDRDDASFVRAVANVLGAALVRAEQANELERMSAQRGRLVAQALEAGELEQRRVADVLHDDVLQHLLFARQEIADGGADAAARARASVEEAATKLRRVVAGLHPVTLAHAGLTAALESLAGEQRARTGLRVDVEVDDAASGEYDRLVVSLARELLLNVIKHAEASRALVRATAQDGSLELLVADDGRGMPADAFESALVRGNIGLASARERVAALGGMTTVCPGIEGRGTGVLISIPL